LLLPLCFQPIEESSHKRIISTADYGSHASIQNSLDVAISLLANPFFGDLIATVFDLRIEAGVRNRLLDGLEPSGVPDFNVKHRSAQSADPVGTTTGKAITGEVELESTNHTLQPA
jgi:hypothetical protein